MGGTICCFVERSNSTSLLTTIPSTFLERTEFDKKMFERMNWKVGSSTATMIALSKFKKMAMNAKKKIASQSEVEVDASIDSNNQKNLSINPPIQPPKLLQNQEGKTREQHISEGKVMLEQRLGFLKLRSHEMIGDGNCQFRAFSYELFGSQDHHLIIRMTIVKYLKTRQNEFMYFVGETENEWNGYLSKMNQSKHWGDEVTLRALCDYFGVIVHLITTEKENWHSVYEPDESHLVYRSENAPATGGSVGPAGSGNGNGNTTNIDAPLLNPLTSSSSSSSPSIRHVFLAYISPIHYNTVELLPTDEG